MKVAELTKEQAELREAIKNFKPKDRKFILTSKATPVTWGIPNRHTKYRPLEWFDPIREEQREIRFCTNHNSIFVDEQKGAVTIGDIVFVDGILDVKKNEVALQKLLLFYHPDRDIIFKEFDPQKKAIQELSSMEIQTKAAMAVMEMDITELEAIARVIIGSSVDNMDSSSIKRDMMIWASSNVQNSTEFNKLANDTDIRLRNLAQRAIDFGIIELRDSGTSVYFVDNNELILKVPFGHNAIVSLTSFLQTDDGIKVMDKIALKLAK